MKKKVAIITVLILFIITIFANSAVYATNDNETINKVAGDSRGTLIQLKENQAKTLEEYKQKYNSDSYGLTAYILHLVQIYSIPFCFLGIVISIIYRVKD